MPSPQILDFRVSAQFLAHRHEVDRLMLLIQPKDRLEHRAVDGIVEIIRNHEITDFDDGIGIQKKRAEHGLFRVERVGLNANGRNRRGRHGEGLSWETASRANKSPCLHGGVPCALGKAVERVWKTIYD